MTVVKAALREKVSLSIFSNYQTHKNCITDTEAKLRDKSTERLYLKSLLAFVSLKWQTTARSYCQLFNMGTRTVLIRSPRDIN